MGDVGLEIWNRLDGKIDLECIATSLADLYQEPVDVVRADVLEFADELVRNGLAARC